MKLKRGDLPSLAYVLDDLAKWSDPKFRHPVELARRLPQRLRAHGLTATSEQITETMMALRDYYEHQARLDEQYADYWRECAHAFTS